MSDVLTSRWTPLRYHKGQDETFNCGKRFRVAACGRRSGKSELAKRFVVLQALNDFTGDGWYVCAAPTHQQAKRIFWNDLKKLSPSWSTTNISESELTIFYIGGGSLTVLGLDKPERIEGPPLSGIILDEFGNMKEDVWSEHVRPALSDKEGWAWFIGVPEGRNHYYRLFNKARAGASDEWAAFTWKSADILPAKEIEAARSELDELSFQQEYEASFISFTGRAYYTFDANHNAVKQLPYDPELDIILMFDFNVSPGVAVVGQEHTLEKGWKNERTETHCIGEVWIPRNSNTLKVCDNLLHNWQRHKGEVFLYGDATGGAGGTAKVEGSDWELVRKKFRPVFGDRLRFRVRKGNPRERERVNSLNSRVCATDGTRALFVDPVTCPKLVEDLEGVTVLEGGTGEIDKKTDPSLTHLSDALGYYVHAEFPLRSRVVKAFSV